MYLEKLYKLKEYIEKRKESLEKTVMPKELILSHLNTEYRVNHDEILGLGVSTFERQFLLGFNRYKNTGVLFENEPYIDFLSGTIE